MSKSLRVYPQKTPLQGEVRVPGDKSISHRSVMFGGIANGTSYIRDWLPAGDTRATLDCMQRLGVEITIDKQSPTAWNLTVEGRGMHGLIAPSDALNCVNAGTGMRLLAGLLAGQKFSSVLDGSEQLRKRPMGRITVPLSEMGANIESVDGKAPLNIEPAAIQGKTHKLKVASAQVKSAILLAGLYAEDPTLVIEPGPARDHTERMLAAMDVDIQTEDRTVTIHPPKNLTALDMRVPADISSAAFVLVAAALVPHSDVTIANVGLNDTRTGVLSILEAMGAEFELKNKVEAGGEVSADIHTRFSELHGTNVSGEVVVKAIDEFPILTVALAQSAGTSTVNDAAELRVKEVDRISVLAGELQKMGVTMDEHPDGYTVTGPTKLSGADVDSHDDHRLGMSLAVAALIADSPTTIKDAECIHDSFPGFVEVMQSLGAKMEWVD